MNQHVYIKFHFTRKHVDDFTIIYFSSCIFLAKLQDSWSLATSQNYFSVFTTVLFRPKVLDLDNNNKKRLCF